VGGLAKTKLIGQTKLTGQALLCFATYNLLCMSSIGLVGRASCKGFRIRAPEMGDMACKQPGLALKIAAETRADALFLRNPRHRCVQREIF
jgi:hypothetical protein